MTAPLRQDRVAAHPELGGILARLEATHPNGRRNGRGPLSPAGALPSSEQWAAAHQVARALIAGQETRLRLFRGDLFADPAWDILLDLFVARLETRAICVSSLCIAARVPASTAHRWIKNMEGEGEIVRRADPVDGRRILLEISDTAFRAMLRQLLDLRARLADIVPAPAPSR